MRVSKPTIAVAVVLAVAVIGAASYAFVSRRSSERNQEPNTAAQSVDGLSIQVMGQSSDPGGLWLRSSGFTPNDSYHTEVYYPQDAPQAGAEYTYIVDGVADGDGATPGWRWDPTVTDSGQPDPPGEYRLTMTDNTTGRKVSTTFFIS